MDVGNVATLSGAGLAAANRTAGSDPQAGARGEGHSQPGERAGSADAMRGQLDSAVADIQKFVQASRRDLNFSIDESTGDVVVKVIDGESGKVVRQIPSEEVLKLAAQLDDMRSLMFETRA